MYMVESFRKFWHDLHAVRKNSLHCRVEHLHKLQSGKVGLNAKAAGLFETHFSMPVSGRSVPDAVQCLHATQNNRIVGYGWSRPERVVDNSLAKNFKVTAGRDDTSGSVFVDEQ